MGGISFEYIGKRENNMSNMHTLEERTFVNHAGDKVVDAAKHKGSCILLGGKGQRIPLAKAIELGLAEGEKKEDKPKDKDK